jgi:hypothetical protein
MIRKRIYFTRPAFSHFQILLSTYNRRSSAIRTWSNGYFARKVSITPVFKAFHFFACEKMNVLNFTRDRENFQGKKKSIESRKASPLEKPEKLPRIKRLN